MNIVPIDKDRRANAEFDGAARGYWRYFGKSVEIGCPKCGKPIQLAQAHVICPDGRVLPRVDCQDNRCKFLCDVQLHGWIAPDTNLRG